MTPSDMTEVRATQNFILGLSDIRASIQEEAPYSAPGPYQQLLAAVAEARRMLESQPTLGQPARFLKAQQPRGICLARRAQQLADACAVPELRELRLGNHLLLYAHSHSAAVLLAIRQEQVMAYRFPRRRR